MAIFMLMFILNPAAMGNGAAEEVCDLIPFSNGGQNGAEKWGYLDGKGKIVISPQFDKAESFAEGLAAVKAGDNWGYGY